MSIYLGFDSSTQSLTVTAIEVAGDRRTVVLERSVVFDEALPAYGTRHGVLASDDPLVAVAPPLMWAEALDLMMAELAAGGIDLSRVRAISGSAQQHGSVYMAQGAGARLDGLDASRPLVRLLDGCFSREVAPVWLDASTREDCRAIAGALGGDAVLARLTGSRAFERFTGPQIRKFARTEPEAYAGTERIHLVSSFLASLLAGRHAPVDPGDASGTNLMELARAQWAAPALAATADRLLCRLPEIRPSWSVVGRLSPYWQQRYGLPAARVVTWSGDNPCSLIGVGLVREGRVVVSLGTSDTVFGPMNAPRVDEGGTGHVFGAPTGAFMGLTCFTNGSLARERVRDTFGMHWREFSDALRRTPAGNHARLMLPWFVPEITPAVLDPHVHRYGLSEAGAAAHVRAVVEGQMMALARHSGWMGVTIDTIHATGGAAANNEIVQIMADVFNARVYRPEVRNSAALGAALRAWHADTVADGAPLSWDEVVALATPGERTRVDPVPAHAARYAELMPLHAACEAHALGRGPNPEPLLEELRQRWPGE